ncbi:MAG: type IV secretion system DNA-binding domain-containing protein, partial [Actinomycetota bacterium]|nr:type IV secretion system DNA-binding domain-containing protein [Actinomycetota bacterium]
MTWLTLRWPREVRPEQLMAALRLLASSAGTPIVLQAIGTASQVEHFLAVPQSHAALVVEHLRATLPGLGVEAVNPPRPDKAPLNQAIKLSFSTRRRPLRSQSPDDITRALLTALSHVGPKERLVLQWVLGRRLAPMVVGSQLPAHHGDSWGKALLAAPWASPTPPDSEARSALRTKQSEAGWRAIGRIAVSATGVPRQRQLLGAVLGALHSIEAPGVSLRASNDNPARVETVHLPWRWPLAINVNELLVMAGWPIGKTSELPVRTVGSRPLAPVKAVPMKGRVIGRSTWPGIERTVAMSPDDSLRHLHVLGPTGVGKSTLLLNLIAQDMHQGRGVVVIEPKGDLIADVLQRVPAKRIGDVVLLDPTDEARPVGLNPLATHGRSPELVADSLLAVFHGLYLSSWGPRTQDILHACLLTLARSGGASLVALPLLLSDPAFRRRLVSR